jgi:hypothetical protein
MLGGSGVEGMKSRCSLVSSQDDENVPEMNNDDSCTAI